MCVCLQASANGDCKDVTCETGDGVTGETSVTGETGDGVTGEIGDGVTGETGDDGATSVSATGDGVTGTSVPGECEEGGGGSSKKKKKKKKKKAAENVSTGAHPLSVYPTLN